MFISISTTEGARAVRRVGIATIALILVATAALVCVSAQREAPINATTDAEFRYFSKTLDGDWTTSAKNEEGRDVEVRYVPANKFAADIVPAILVLERKPLRLKYSYSIVNHVESIQQIANMHFGPHMPIVHQVEGPNSWMRESHPEWVMLAAVDGDPPMTGIAPGSSAMVSMQSGNLPGVVSVRVRGNAPVPAVPETMGAERTREFELLSQRNQSVDMFTIGPVISFDSESEEDSAGVAIARVVNHYDEQMRRFNHPQAAQFHTTFMAAMTGRNGRAALEEVRRISAASSGSVWQHEMAKAVETCADVILLTRFH